MADLSAAGEPRPRSRDSAHTPKTARPGYVTSSVPAVAALPDLSATFSARGQPDQRTQALRTKLISVGDRFIGFEKSVEEEAHRRHAGQEVRVQELMESLGRLEKAMNVEIRRRVEANKTLQQMTERIANEMLERVQRKVHGRVESLGRGLEALQARCLALERGIQQFKGELPSKLKGDMAALGKEIAALRSLLEQQRAARGERDGQLMQRAEELEVAVSTQFDREDAVVADQLTAVERELEALGKADESQGEQFRAYILEEVAGLKSGLAGASQARDAADDEIVSAINQYTNALHKGMRHAR